MAKQVTLWPGSPDMEKIGKDEPCLILMNHSCFLDMQIAYRILYPRQFNIVATSDGFVGFGKALLMRLLGCIPTQKFVSDVTLIRDMEYMLKEKKTSVLMYPEASYSFDGTATPLPESLGKLVRKLGKPVVMITTTAPKTSMDQFIYSANYDEAASSTSQLCCSPVWMQRTTPTANGWSSDNYRYIAIGY